jgi:hypothetical protein
MAWERIERHLANDAMRATIMQALDDVGRTRADVAVEAGVSAWTLRDFLGGADPNHDTEAKLWHWCQARGLRGVYAETAALSVLLEDFDFAAKPDAREYVARWILARMEKSGVPMQPWLAHEFTRIRHVRRKRKNVDL